MIMFVKNKPYAVPGPLAFVSTGMLTFLAGLIVSERVEHGTGPERPVLLAIVWMVIAWLAYKSWEDYRHEHHYAQEFVVVKGVRLYRLKFDRFTSDRAQAFYEDADTTSLMVECRLDHATGEAVFTISPMPPELCAEHDLPYQNFEPFTVRDDNFIRINAKAQVIEYAPESETREAVDTQ